MEWERMYPHELRKNPEVLATVTNEEFAEKIRMHWGTAWITLVRYIVETYEGSYDLKRFVPICDQVMQERRQTGGQYGIR